MMAPVKARQQRADRRPRSAARRSVAIARPSASSVSVSIAPAHREAVGLAAVHHERHGLGRLAERDRQHAGGERIERAGVAGLPGRERALDHARPRGSRSCRPACRAPASRRRRASRACAACLRRRLRPHGVVRCSASFVPRSRATSGDSQQLLDALRLVETSSTRKRMSGCEFQVDAPARSRRAGNALVALERRHDRSLRRARRAAST